MAVVLMGDSSLGVAPQHLYNCFVCVEHNPSLPHTVSCPFPPPCGSKPTGDPFADSALLWVLDFILNMFN